MSTSVDMNELSPLDRTRGLAEGWTRAAMGLLIAVGVALFVVSTIYLISPVGPADPPNQGRMPGVLK